MRAIETKFTNKQIIDKFYNLGWDANFLDAECEYLNEFIQFITCNYDEIAIALIKDHFTELKKYKSKMYKLNDFNSIYIGIESLSWLPILNKYYFKGRLSDKHIKIYQRHLKKVHYYLID